MSVRQVWEGLRMPCRFLLLGLPAVTETATQLGVTLLDQDMGIDREGYSAQCCCGASAGYNSGPGPERPLPSEPPAAGNPERCAGESEVLGLGRYPMLPL
jgi:hypothetical protein